MGEARDSRQATGVAGPSLTGGCLCGGVRFELTEPAKAAGYCHSTRCQRRTGTASSAQARIDGGTFRPLEGHDLVAEATSAVRSGQADLNSDAAGQSRLATVERV